MTTVDWLLIAALFVSCVFGLMRGFVKEAMSLTIWLSALLLARIFGGNLASLLIDVIESPSVRWLVANGILFVGTVLIGSMISHLIAELVRLTGLSGPDRVLGMAFGLVRGLVILVAIVYGLQFTLIPQDSWWLESQLIPYLEQMTAWARQHIPAAAGQLWSFAS